MDPEAEVTMPIADGQDIEADEKPGGMYQVWMLAISLSILQIGFGIVIPIFPFYIESLGMAGLELGALAASFAVARIILAGPMGRLSDRVGRRPILIFSLLGFAFSNFVYAFATDVIVMISARALEGAVSAGFFPAANALVSDLTTIKNRGTAMGYLSMGNMVGFVIGPALGGFLAQFLGIRIPFILAGIATLFTMVLLYILVQEPVTKSIKDAVPKIPIREVLSRARGCYGALGMAMFANMFAMGILEVAFMLDAVINIGVEPYEIGIFFGVIGITMMIGNIVFGKLSDLRGRKWLIVIGALIGAGSMGMFILAQDTVTLVIAGIVLSIGMSMRGPAIQALIADVTDPSAYGTMMGVFGAVSNSAYAVSPLIGGKIFDDTGSAALSLLLGGGVSIAGAVVAAVLLPSSASKDTCAFDSEPEVEGIEVT
ncbi:MAG: Tetracycline resistance protein, class B [Candidatus Thorarchaeota archaeon AB_25]|nr:MAG: Tetracycline resistance protein, class B [Candidatus Thorarchaeota archaeon AB_25]